jgi:Glycosyl transferase family 2
MKLSVIISSFNYARYLRCAIDSALAQPLDLDIVVVDDGSEDESREIIRSYGKRVKAVFQSNAGQAAALNAGWNAACGDIVIFLDSDDCMSADAATKVLHAFENPSIAKAHWNMLEVDASGKSTGQLVPRGVLSQGDLRDTILRDGPEAYHWPPTSGNAWRRSAFERYFPIPEGDFRVCPDVYLAALAPMAGAIARIDEPLSCWRRHGGNNTWAERFEVRLPRFCRQWDLACDALASHCRVQGFEVNPEIWRKNAWCHRVMRAASIIRGTVPAGETFALIDQGEWGADEHFFGRTCLPFPNRNRVFWGCPHDDAAAIQALSDAHLQGARFIIKAWHCEWWKAQYPGLFRELEQRAVLCLSDENVEVFELRL